MLSHIIIVSTLIIALFRLFAWIVREHDNYLMREIEKRRKEEFEKMPWHSADRCAELYKQSVAWDETKQGDNK